MRQKALDNNQIVNPHVPPRHVWDLYSNRVVPHWIILHEHWSNIWAISHAWKDEEDQPEIWTDINGREWPVPIPKDANLDLIRIEMLNLGAEYVWLDVLCLRCRGGPRDDLCEDVTIFLLILSYQALIAISSYLKHLPTVTMTITDVLNNGTMAHNYRLTTSLLSIVL